MTHRGPFQPLLFCDSVIPVTVPRGGLNVTQFIQLRWKFIADRIYKTSVDLYKALKHSTSTFGVSSISVYHTRVATILKAKY